MLSRALAFSLMVFTLLIGGGLLFYFPITSLEKYDFKQAKEKAVLVTKNPPKSAPKQNRWGVTKDLFISQEEGGRLHHHIESQNSSLEFTKEEGKLVVIEHLGSLECLIQDRILGQKEAPFQQIRSFKAVHGSYNYSSHELIAHHALLSFFKLPGIELPRHITSKPYLTGVAKDISLTVMGKSPQFEATHFEAHFQEQR
ncbi:hypothetical protein [Rhabdochlamydiaceae symbiont of Dictyostelium giganteum]|uniref:hypothetical protein n=1 Tax=Rhabdochlamydiaceae symbiont of Dictyostelium giganteum TaxID=3342349 RepID=UPI00384C83C5